MTGVIEDVGTLSSDRLLNPENGYCVQYTEEQRRRIYGADRCHCRGFGVFVWVDWMHD
jgi:hypothetical protein